MGLRGRLTLDPRVDGERPRALRAAVLVLLGIIVGACATPSASPSARASTLSNIHDWDLK